MSILIILHGLVHFWYVVLSLRWVTFQPEMGWTGQSWALSPLLRDLTVRALAGSLYSIAALAFLVGGFSLIAGSGWSSPWLIATAVFSALVILIFWDGKTQMIIQKGVIGFLLNIILIVVFLIS